MSVRDFSGKPATALGRLAPPYQRRRAGGPARTIGTVLPSQHHRDTGRSSHRTRTAVEEGDDVLMFCVFFFNILFLFSLRFSTSSSIALSLYHKRQYSKFLWKHSINSFNSNDEQWKPGSTPSKQQWLSSQNFERGLRLEPRRWSRSCC